MGRVEDAIAQLRQTLRLQPNFVPALDNLAWTLATCPTVTLRNGPEALELAQRAARVSGGENPRVLRTLAAAYAVNGRLPDAATVAQQALRLAEVQTNAYLVEALNRELQLYQAGVPSHPASSGQSH